MRTSTFFWALTCSLLPALGNVEKTIFLAPPSISIPSGHPNLKDLYLDVLFAPLSWLSLRRQVPASFPTPNDPRGNETWLLLEGLEEGRRYEVRICWVATVRALVIHLRSKQSGWTRCFSGVCLLYAIATDILSLSYVPIGRSLRQSGSHFFTCCIFRKAPGHSLQPEGRCHAIWSIS